MLAKSAMHICGGNSCGTRLRRSAQGQTRTGHMGLLRRSGVPTTTTTTAASARTRSPLVVAAASPSAVPIKFQISYRTEYGQVLKVVGAGELLGEWDPKQAPAMEWEDGDIWSTTLPLPAGHHEFKLVVAAADASSSIWEGGNNRSVTVPSPATTGGSSYVAECHWGNPETIMRPGGPEGVATYDDGDDENIIDSDDKAASSSASGIRQTIGKMTVEGAASVDDDEEKEIGKMTIGKMTVDGGTAGRDAPSNEVGKITIGKMTVEQDPKDSMTVVGKMTIEGGVSVINDLVDSGIGAEEGSSAAAAMTPETAFAMASGDEDQLESPFAKAISGVLKNLGLQSRDDNDDDEDHRNQGGRSGRASENKPSGGRPGSTGAGPSSGPSSFTFAAAAAAAILMTSTTSAGAANAALPMMALPRQFFPPTNPRSPFRNLSSWVVPVPPPFTSPAHAAAQGQEEKLLIALASTSNKDNNASALDAPTTSTASTTAAGQTENDPNAQVVDDDSSTLEEFRERLRWLNKITADAQQELDTIAPPPLKSALDSAVKAAKETDVQPALDVTKRALDDLQEGFTGLFSSAKEFDAATASAQLKARMEKELEARKEIENAVAAAAAESAAKEAAAAEKVAADEAKGSSKQQQQQQQGLGAVVPAAPSPAAK
ncbi:hypothetical protein Ndes2437B_g07750 [Nannochloris sp. 'desiccata']